MALRRNDIPVPKLRAHQPLHADSLTPPYADAVSSVAVTEDLAKAPLWGRKHLFSLAIGACLMFMLWLAFSRYVVPFAQDKIDHWNCGEARVCQYDLNVGHDGTSHFVTQYWQGQVIVIEFAGGKSSNVQVYDHPMFVVGTDNQPRMVTLETAYVTRHSIAGKPDLVAAVSGFSSSVVFYNTGSGFSTTEVP